MSIDFQVNELAPCRKEVQVNVTKGKVSSAYNRVIGQFGTISLPGFRKGKAPKSVILKKYGEDIQNEVRQSLFAEAMQELFNDDALTPLTNPEIENGELSQKAEYSFKLTYDVAPAFELPTYKELELTRAPYVESEEKVEEAVNGLLKSHAVLSKVEEAAVEEDFVKANFSITVKTDEEVPEDAQSLLSGEDRWITVKSDSPVPGAVENLTGVSADEEKTYTATFAEDYNFNPFLAGKEAEVTVKVIEVQRYVLPELNDEFAAKINKESAEQVKEEAAENAKNQFENQEKSKMADAALEILLDGFSLDLPPTILEGEVADRKHRLAHEKAGQHEGECNHSDDELSADELAEIEAEAKKALTSHFLLLKIAKEEALKVEDYEVMSQIYMMAYQYGISPENLEKQFPAHKKEELKEQILVNKALSQVVELAKVTEVEA